MVGTPLLIIYILLSIIILTLLFSITCEFIELRYQKCYTNLECDFFLLVNIVGKYQTWNLYNTYNV